MIEEEVIEDEAEAFIPIDTTVLEERSFEEQQKIQYLLNESYVLSNRLNQLRYKIRQTDRDKREIDAISKQIEKLTQELNELEEGKSHVFGWRKLFSFRKK